MINSTERLAVGVTDTRGVYGRVPTRQESALQGRMMQCVKSIAEQTGLKPRSDIYVGGNAADAINYTFSIMMDLPPGKLAVAGPTIAVQKEFSSVCEYIAQNCKRHLIRAEPHVSVEGDFERNCQVLTAYMRGHMHGAEENAGPAQLVRPDPNEPVDLSMLAKEKI